MMLKYYFYNAHGLTIKSSIKLPGIQYKNGKANVKITLGRIYPFTENCREVDLTEDVKARIRNDFIILLWQNQEICSIKNGSEIILNISLDLNEDFIRLIVLGFAIPLLLYQRRITTLHANAVNLNGKAVVLLGPMGVGKSTTSIALHKKGHNLISDDVLAINTDDLISVFNGFSSLKLWPEIIEEMGEDPKLSPKLSSISDKRFFQIDNFNHTNYPISKIYSIKNADKTFIEEMSPHQSLMELVKATNFAVIFDRSELIKNLELCKKISMKVPVKTLYINRSLRELPEVVEVIEKDNN